MELNKQEVTILAEWMTAIFASKDIKDMAVRILFYSDAAIDYKLSDVKELVTKLQKEADK